jgi:hypothetical protein
MKFSFRSLYRKLPIIRDIRTSNHEIANELGITRHEHQTLSSELIRILQYMRRGQQAGLLHTLMGQERYDDPKRLTRHEYQVHSQHGEDGIIAEILRRIGVKEKTFVEIGVGDGLENNTAYLLFQGWTGCWVDGGPEGSRAIRENLGPRLSDGTLKFIEMFVTMENIAAALKSAGVQEEIDVMSLDVDRNTFYIWSALAHIRARVVVVEYNPKFPPSIDWKITYDAQRWWDGTFYYGASLKAYERLGRQLGYCLVGCDFSGTNAFFVREDLCAGAFLEPFDAETHYEPPRYWLWTHLGEIGKATEPWRDRRGYAGLNP